MAAVDLYPNGSSSAVRTPTVSAYDGFGGYHSYTADGLNYDVYNPVGFGGQYGYYHDYQGYYLLGHRYYDPRAGRFVTRDPIGYGGGINLYGFVGNNPVNESDPSGYIPIPKLDAGNGIDWAKVGAVMTRFLRSGTIGRTAKSVIEEVGEAQGYQGLNPPSVQPMNEGASPDARASQEMEQEDERVQSAVLPEGGTYILRDPVNGKVMRTGMAANLTKRKSDHKKEFPGLIFEVDKRSSDRSARRGREQIIHDLYQPPLNKQNPIKRKNYTLEQYQKMMDAGGKL